MLKRKQIQKLTDPELVTLYKESEDKSIVGVLFERYTRFIFLVCMKYFKDEEKSKDATMQVFEKLFTYLEKHEISNFKPWLHTVSKNHCLLVLRGDKPRRDYETEIKKDYAGYMESGNILYLENENERETKLQQLEDAIKLLSKEQRICIELFYLKELCYNEVAEKTGFSLKKVKSYIQNGKRNLKTILLKKHEQQLT